MITKVSLIRFRPPQKGKPSFYALKKTVWCTTQSAVEERLWELREFLIDNHYSRFPIEKLNEHIDYVVLESQRKNSTNIYREYWSL